MAAGYPDTVILASIKDGTALEFPTATIARMSEKVEAATRNPNRGFRFQISNANTDEIVKFAEWCRYHKDLDLVIWSRSLTRSVTEADIRGLGHLSPQKIVNFGIIAHVLEVPILKRIMVAKWRNLVLNMTLGEVQILLRQNLTMQNKASLERILDWTPPDDVGLGVDDIEVDENAPLL